MKKNRVDNVRRRPIRGFTLIEVMVVLFILLALASVAVVSYRGTQQRAERDNTQLYVKSLAKAIEMYRQHVGRFPTSLNDLIEPPSDLPDPAKWGGPYLQNNLQTHDPWGNEYRYATPGTKTREGFDVWSPGIDCVDDTDDDIGNWTN